jgi:hypothetical protein
VAAQLVQNAGVIGRVNLLSARGGAKEAGCAGQTVLVRLGGKGSVFGMCVRLAFKGGKQVLNGSGVIHGNCWHEKSPFAPFTSLRVAKEDAL